MFCEDKDKMKAARDRRAGAPWLALLALLWLAPSSPAANDTNRGAKAAPPRARTTKRVIGALRLSATLRARPGGGVSVHLTAPAASRRTRSRVQVRVLERLKMPPMARVLPLPHVHGARTVEIALAAGRPLDRTVHFPRVKLGSLSRAWVAFMPVDKRRGRVAVRRALAR